MKKKLCVGIALLLGMVCAVLGRAWYDFQSNLAQARGIAEQNPNQAIQHYRKALGWAFRVEPTLNEALDFVETKISDNSKKLDALRDLRRGVYGSRGFLDQLNGRAGATAKLDAEIIKLEPKLADPERIREIDPPVAHYQNQLLALICLLGWIGSVFYAIWFGFDSKGKAKLRGLVQGLAGWAVFFSAWLFFLAA